MKASSPERHSQASLQYQQLRKFEHALQEMEHDKKKKGTGMNAVSSVLKAIGNTPLVELRNIVPPGSARVFVKLEYYDPTGSYKDRMALAIIEEAEKRDDLRPGKSSSLMEFGLFS